MKIKGLRLRTWVIVKILGIKIIFDNNMKRLGGWDRGKTIYLKTTAGDMACLHEIGHVLNSYDCCREHDEWRAHGFSVGVAKILAIPAGEIEKMNKAMSVYSKWESVCPRNQNSFEKTEAGGKNF